MLANCSTVPDYIPVMSNQDAIAQFLARNGGPTKCPPADTFATQATTLRRGRRQHERHLIDRAFDRGDEEIIVRERGAESNYLRIQGIGE